MINSVICILGKIQCLFWIYIYIYTFNSHGTRWQCTAKKFYYAVFNAYRLKLTLIMYFLCSKNSIRVLKMSFPVNFWFTSGEISVEKKNFWKNFIAPKDSFLNFRGSLLSNFWAIVLIFADMRILEDFGSLLPARSVTVKYIHDR